MGNSAHGIIRLASGAALACGLFLGVLPMPGAASQGSSRMINGFEVSGRFLEEWGKSGSEQSNVYVNGLPITARRAEISMEDGKTYQTQWFERARYEAHPENPRPYDVLLGRLGSTRVEGRSRIEGKCPPSCDAQPFLDVPRPADLSATKLWFPETKHTISGKILEYWNRYGGLKQFGFPLSEPFQEASEADGKTYTVQYFERNRMEAHPEKPAPYEVELGLLGVEQYKMQPVPGDALPVAPSKDVTSKKETIVVAMSQEPRNLTFADTSSAANRIRSLIEDKLVGRDDNDNLFPLNAWYVPTLENGGARFIGQGDDRYLQVKYKLRQGIKWSDGKELTSNDAIFAYRLMLAPGATVPNRSEYQKLLNIDNPDKYTIIYNYMSLNQAKVYYNSQPDKENYAFVKSYIDQKKPVTSRSYSEIGVAYPEHVLGKIPPAQLAESEAGRAPVGTGPWKIASWNKKQEMVLVQNEHYSLTVKPAIKTIRIKFITDLTTMSSQLKTREMQLVTSETFNLPPADRAGFEAAGFKVAGRPASTWEHLDFYFTYYPFQEKAVREAIITAINRQRIVDTVYQGMGGVMNSVIPPGVYFSLDNPNFTKNYPDIAATYKLPIYYYNPDRAAALLEEAGWRCPAGTGGRDCGGQPRAKGGVKLQFEYATTTQAVRQQIQALVHEDLKAIGVDAVTKNYSSDVFFAGDNTDPRMNGTTKLAQYAYVTTRDSDFREWVCERVPDYAMDAGTWSDIALENSYRLCNPMLKAANDRFKFDIDPSVQAVAAAEAQSLIMQDIHTIPLVQRPNVEVVTNQLGNYKLPNNTTSSFWNARQWYFK